MQYGSKLRMTEGFVYTPLIDGHVHIYDCFDLQALLNSAYENFADQANNKDLEGPFIGVLMLAESEEYPWFLRLQQNAENDTTSVSTSSVSWQFSSLADDSCAIVAQRRDQELMIIVSGRQIITAEGLEVLALATKETLDNGSQIKDLLQTLHRTNTITVIPWGVGKWLGRRGKILREILRSSINNSFFLGDNGGRPIFWPTPYHIREALSLGIKNLPGTDPLPIASEVSRVGSFGFVLDHKISVQRPAKDIKKLLLSPNVSARSYGTLQRPFRFFINQTIIRL